MLRVNILFAMGGEKYVVPLLQPQPGEDITRLNFGKVIMQNLSHGRSAYIRVLRCNAGSVQISPRMFRVTYIYVTYDVYYATIGLFWQAFIEAAVAGFHVEDWYVQAFRSYYTQTGIGVTEHKNGIGPTIKHELV